MLKKTVKTSMLAFLVLQSSDMMAQFLPAQPAVQPVATPLWTINGQVRTRTELRQGLGNPYDKGSTVPAIFTSQRTNLNVGYRWDKLNFNIDLRDVRVWGQDASQINNADGAKLFVHQAWADIVLGTTADTNAKFQWFDNFSVKVGRQELVYDDVRLLGNLDWLQQGRRHDMALFKFLKKGYDFHVGMAMNQNTDGFNTHGNVYNGNNAALTTTQAATTGGKKVIVQTLKAGQVADGVNPMLAFNNTAATTNAGFLTYKYMQFLYLTRKFNQTKISILALKDDFQKYKRDTLTGSSRDTTGYVCGTDFSNPLGNKLNTRYTIGGQISSQGGNVSTLKWTLNAGFYHQGGKDRLGSKMNANHAFIYGLLSKGKFSFGPGYEYLSGNDAQYTAGGSNINGNRGLAGKSVDGMTLNKRFDPLYGTPHRWWGYMDYFYVGTGSPISGLQDLYFRFKYDHSANFNILMDVHNFMSAANIEYRPNASSKFEKQSKSYGQEIDIVANWQFNRFCNLELGASGFFSTNTLNLAKGFNKDTKETFNKWAYVMLNIRPDFLFQKPQPITN